MYTSAALLTQTFRNISTNVLEVRQRYPEGCEMPFNCGFNEVFPTAQMEGTIQRGESEKR